MQYKRFDSSKLTRNIGAKTLIMNLAYIHFELNFIFKEGKKMHGTRVNLNQRRGKDQICLERDLGFDKHDES